MYLDSIQYGTMITSKLDKKALEIERCCPADEVSRKLAINTGCDCGGPSFANAGFVHRVRSYSRVEGNGNAGGAPA